MMGRNLQFCPKKHSDFAIHTYVPTVSKLGLLDL